MEYQIKERGVEVGRMSIDSTGYSVLSGPRVLDVFSDLGGIMGNNVKAHVKGKWFGTELRDSQLITSIDMRALVQRKLEGFGFTMTS